MAASSAESLERTTGRRVASAKTALTRRPFFSAFSAIFPPTVDDLSWAAISSSVAV